MEIKSLYNSRACLRREEALTGIEIEIVIVIEVHQRRMSATIVERKGIGQAIVKKAVGRTDVIVAERKGIPSVSALFLEHHQEVDQEAEAAEETEVTVEESPVKIEEVQETADLIADRDPDQDQALGEKIRRAERREVQVEIAVETRNLNQDQGRDHNFRVNSSI
mmetsp:Transcript_43928/g.50818  ORF Transcript_43928/g.50818 Transcript_43928/m.50818 type:complete len:165 (+) Transcript_43928:223-717(+)